jgi:predicted nucleotidyltransferase
MPGIRALTQVEEELRSRVADEVAGWKAPAVSLIVYGSLARGESKPGSDVDLLAIRPDETDPDEPSWESQLAELAEHIRQWTGRSASVVEMSRSEAVDGLAGKEPFLLSADRDGWVIAGQTLRGLVAGSR